MNNTPRTHIVTKGNTRTPIGALLTQGGKPVDLASLTVQAVIKDAKTKLIVQAATSVGVVKQPTSAFTVDVSSNRIISNDHRVNAGDQVIVSSATTLPGGLAAATRYFARDVEDNSFALALTRTGRLTSIADAGTGTHSYFVVGSVTYDFASGNVSAAGAYWLYFVVTDGSGEKDTFPHDDEKLKVEVVDPGF